VLIFEIIVLGSIIGLNSSSYHKYIKMVKITSTIILEHQL